MQATASGVVEIRLAIRKGKRPILQRAIIKFDHRSDAYRSRKRKRRSDLGVQDKLFRRVVTVNRHSLYRTVAGIQAIVVKIIAGPPCGRRQVEFAIGRFTLPLPEDFKAGALPQIIAPPGCLGRWKNDLLHCSAKDKTHFASTLDRKQRG